MSRFTLWNHGGAVIVGLVLGLISPQLGKLPMYALWFGVLLGWTTVSARRQPDATRGWWSSIVLWLVALVTYEVYLAVIFAHMGQSLAWKSLGLGVLLTAVVGVPVASVWHRTIRSRHRTRTISP